MVNLLVIASCLILSKAARIKQEDDSDTLQEEIPSVCKGKESCYVWNTHHAGNLTCYNRTTHQCLSRENGSGEGPFQVCQVGEVLCGDQCSNAETGVCCGQLWHPHSTGQKQCCTGRCTRGCEQWACNVTDTCLPAFNPDFDDAVHMMGEVGGFGRCDVGTPEAAMACLVTVQIDPGFDGYSPGFGPGATIKIPIGQCTQDAYGIGMSHSVSLRGDADDCFLPGTDFSRGCPSVTNCNIFVQWHSDAHCTTRVNSRTFQIGTSNEITLTTETE